MTLKAFVSEYLTFLELQEARLLSWGFYNVMFDASETGTMFDQAAPNRLKAAWRLLESEGWSHGTLLEEMEHNGLLYRVVADEDRYRTRFAEGVRLLARLRQMFKPEDWSTGPALVSDIKVHLAPRRYPRRDQSAADCWRDIEGLCWQADLQRAIFDALSVGRDGRALYFSNFQRSAFKHILSRYREQGLSGSVISAGTGSGKTKAFYIPAFLCAVTELPPRQQPFTKIMAIYPRNVLLADQLREAISEALKIRPVLERLGLRALRFGALLGATPDEKKFNPDDRGKYPVEKIGWKRLASGFVIPFLKSPQSPDEDLVWRDEDRKRGSTALYRAGGDSSLPDVPDGVLILTREQLKVDPPDILFLSAEMLNREMGNPEWAATFGIGQGQQAPRLLLLDEVHAYEGVSGAQVAWVLRRWRYWSGIRNLHFVGLSATLKDAGKHLGLVTGTPATSIQEFTPSERELDMRDVEYNLAVKGDPASGASLLATSIQCTMLLTRLLTPKNVPLAQEDEFRGAAFYGRKVFGFTDNLDSLNRWYSDLTDAERNLRLARLRILPQRRQPPVNLSPSIVKAMEQAGQVWELPRRLGHNLNQPLNVSRCSSQDPGANVGSDVIVASSSLEVGFDDPEVGAILHHKRPVSASAFIQRKGRAGRRVGTRPWTVVVLSDYGADRWAFQNAERLFQPEIDSIFLPISNPYVLRIQATYFLVDWIGRRVGQGSPFRYLRYHQHPQARRVIEILEDFIRLGPEWRKFRRDFSRAFSQPYGSGGRILTEAEMDSILWRVPRPLLRHVVPTLLRKVQARWGYADADLTGKYEDDGANRPLPQYLPAATFSEISGMGVRLIFPLGEEQDDEQLTAPRALFEVCPGRVSKRYALRVEAGYWLKFSEQLRQSAGRSAASVRELFPDRLLMGRVGGVLVYQLQSVELQRRPPDVLDSSNASWNWENRLRPISAGTRLPLFIGSPWQDIVGDCVAHLHRDHSGIDIIRFAPSCEFEVRLQRGRSARGILTLASTGDDGRVLPEAVGFQLNADGIVLRIKGEHFQRHADSDGERTSRFRPDYLLDQMKSCVVLSEHMNKFLVEWLWQTSLAMLSATALRQRCSLENAQQLLKGKRVRAAQHLLDSIFQIYDVGVAGEESKARLKERILQEWADPVVVQRIEQLEALLWKDLDEPYQNWVRRRYLATLAHAFRSAAVSRLSEVSEDDLMVDVVFTERGDAEIYLTETNSGGLGQIEVVAQELRQSPELLLDGIRYALSYCPRNFVTNNVLGVLAQVTSVNGKSEPVATTFANARAARGFRQLAEARRELQATLDHMGFDSSRQVVVSIVTKLLRTGSSLRTDVSSHLLNRAWHRHEKRLGIAIDPRVFAYLCVQYGPVRRRMAQVFREISCGEDPTDAQLYAGLQQFLFSGCEDSCPECLEHPNYFNSCGRPSRSLAVDWLSIKIEEVSVDDHPKDWIELARKTLLRHSRVRVKSSSSHITSVARALQGLLADEIETEFLLLPVSIAGIERSGPNWLITLQLRGATHGY